MHKLAAYHCRTAAATPSTPTSTSGCRPTPRLRLGRRSWSTSACARCGCSPTTRQAAALEGFGLEIVEQVPLEVHATPENLRYLQTKRDRMGHDLVGLPEADGPPATAVPAAEDVPAAGAPRASIVVAARGDPAGRHRACSRRADRVSGAGAPDLRVTGAEDLRGRIVASLWHETVMDGLVGGALRGLAECGIDEPTVVRVARRVRAARRGRSARVDRLRRRRRAGRGDPRRHARTSTTSAARPPTG
jgi:hypothetical protein